MSWKLINKEILLTLKNGEVSPDAQAIYKIEFKGLEIFNDEFIQKPSTILTNIQFLKQPADIKLKLSIENNNILLNIIVFADSLDIIITNWEDIKHEYIITDNKWIPIIPGKLKTVLEILNRYTPGTKYLNLKDALELKKEVVAYDVHLDEDIKSDILISRINLVSNYFTAKLYNYQTEGFTWMNFMLHQNMGFVVADEMGLGKSIQIIRLLCQRLTENNSLSLVISPASILENWKREFHKFTKGIKTHIHQGQERTGSPNYLKLFDLIITSYETLNLDYHLFKSIKWDLVIIDEAQAIKNPSTQRTKAVKALDKNFGIAVTGTPFENKLTDIWSIIDFIYPGYLSTLSTFEATFQNNVKGGELVEPHISPLILRRRVSEVAKDLPEKIIINQVIVLHDSMIQEYETIRKETKNNLTKNNLLASLTRLRMFCCDPRLLNSTNFEFENNKLSRLFEILEEIISLNEKVIIFTSFQKMSDLIQFEIRSRYSIFCKSIDGRTAISERQFVIDEYSNVMGSAALVLNPRAAGTGLNITAANHVIHYNSEWNPAVEDQASARSYRRGQTLPVRIYKLFYSNTIEDVIQNKLVVKRDISETAIIGVKGDTLSFNEIFDALNVSPKLNI